MRAALIDTDTISLFLRNHPEVVANFQSYLEDYSTIQFSIITYYEIVSGLKHRDARKQLLAFLELAAQSTVLPLTEQSTTISGDLYAQLRTAGTPIDDIDLLIAGTAIANGLVLVSHNQKHFGRIPQLQLEDWTEPQ
jgi:tRNA(fMet)-specific endonuclease VapC